MKTIFLLLPLQFGFAREVYRSVAEATSLHPGWSIYAGTVEDLHYFAKRRVRLEGIVGFLAYPDVGRLAASVGRVCVNVSNVLVPSDTIDSVINDDRAIGRLAAGHLLDRGFRRLHYLEWDTGTRHGLERWEGLAEAAAQRGAQARRSVIAHRRSFLAFLRRMERPAALVLHADTLANVVIRELTQFGWAVPADVAVLGVDDDDLLAGTTTPPISSVRPGAAAIGRTAVQWILDGPRRGAPRVVRIPPEGITQRLSTDGFAVEDERLRRALAALEAGFRGPVDIPTIARKAGLSRRHLTQLFVDRLGASPSRWRENRRLAEARRLLCSTTLPLEEVADRCGYSGPVSFWRAFRKVEGMAPGEYRRKQGGG